MLSIYATTENHPRIREIIQMEDRLEELIDIFDSLEHKPGNGAMNLLIKKGNIAFPIDWQNQLPPYLFPEEIPLSPENLLGIVFSRLNNMEKAHSWLYKYNPGLYKELDILSRMQEGLPVNGSELAVHYSPFEDYRLMHNQAVLGHYNATDQSFDPEKILYFYEEAMKEAPHEEYRAFTTRHCALLLIDLGMAEQAQDLLQDLPLEQLSSDAATEIRYTLTQSWLQQLAVPYDQEKLELLKSTLWDVLQAYEKQERNAETGLLLLDASHIANISDSFSESLGYVTRAIRLFEAEGLSELAASAQFRKGTLLYTWAQQDNPQFFKPAIESFQEALKVFSKEAAPEVFAEIHHHLGVLYTDMPSEHQKKSIWAGIAVASFQEALNFYTKAAYPYQYGTICNNYGNAFSKFPQAIHTDNYEKALFYYQEALDVRTNEFPYERAITLLNFLEASWNVGNDPETFNEERFRDMLAKAKEVKQLVSAPDMLEEAQKHLDMLEALKQVAAK